MLVRGGYERAVRLLPDLYRARTLESLPKHIVDLMPGLIPADSYAYNETNFAHRRFTTLMDPLPDECGLRDLNGTLARLMHQHPMVQHNRHSDQRALKLSDLVSRKQFHRLELYDAAYRPARIEYLMTGGFPVSPAGDIVTLGFGRTAIDFSEEERDLLNFLRPHLTQAYRNAEAMTTFQSQVESREGSLEEAVNAAVIVVRNVTIKHASPLALRWLSSFFPGRDGAAPNGTLPDLVGRWVRCWQTSFDCKRSEIRPCSPLTVESADGRLTIRFLKTGENGEAVLLLAHEVRRDRTELLQHLGLSRRESEVLLWISRGKTSREIAAILSIARKTVDKHVEHIQAKLGAENRIAAAAIAWAALHTS
jgi:DNA-binding CsgD family transcriptional regulator